MEMISWEDHLPPCNTLKPLHRSVIFFIPHFPAFEFFFLLPYPNVLPPSLHQEPQENNHLDEQQLAAAPQENDTTTTTAPPPPSSSSPHDWESIFEEERQENGIFSGIIGPLHPLTVLTELRRAISSEREARAEAAALRHRLAAAAAEAAFRVQDDITLRKELHAARTAADPSVLQLRQLILEPSVNREFQRLSAATTAATMEAAALKSDLKALHEIANHPNAPLALTAKVRGLEEKIKSLKEAKSETAVVAVEQSLAMAKLQLDEMRHLYGELEDHTHSLEDEMEGLQRELQSEKRMRAAAARGGNMMMPSSSLQGGGGGGGGGHWDEFNRGGPPQQQPPLLPPSHHHHQQGAAWGGGGSGGGGGPLPLLSPPPMGHHHPPPSRPMMGMMPGGGGGSDKQRNTCFKCGEEGHYARDCPHQGGGYHGRGGGANFQPPGPPHMIGKRQRDY